MGLHQSLNKLPCQGRYRKKDVWAGYRVYVYYAVDFGVLRQVNLSFQGWKESGTVVVSTQTHEVQTKSAKSFGMHFQQTKKDCWKITHLNLDHRLFLGLAHIYQSHAFSSFLSAIPHTSVSGPLSHILADTS